MQGTRAKLGVPRTGWDAVGTARPWLRVVNSRILCTWPEAPNVDLCNYARAHTAL